MSVPVSDCCVFTRFKSLYYFGLEKRIDQLAINRRIKTDHHQQQQQSLEIDRSTQAATNQSALLTLVYIYATGIAIATVSLLLELVYARYRW